VGYLEDGTMVVVEDARKRIGERLLVTVTGALQTPTGRMVFARQDKDRPKDSAERTGEKGRNSAAGVGVKGSGKPIASTEHPPAGPG